MGDRQNELFDRLPSDSLNQETFEQILEMDEDDTEFSRGIVLGFLDQAEQTFSQMDQGIEQKDLPHLSSLGHFLKGSSATIGLFKMRDSCEKIQHYGHGMDGTGSHELDSAECLRLIVKELSKMRADFEQVDKALKEFYEADG